MAEKCTNEWLVIEVLVVMNLPFDDMYSCTLESFPVYLCRLATWPVKQYWFTSRNLRLIHTLGGVCYSVYLLSGYLAQWGCTCVTHLNDWSNNVDMNPVLSEMSDEDDWWLIKFFCIKGMGKEYINLLIKHYDLQKMKCFIKI